jgi:hypothetical protein
MNRAIRIFNRPTIVNLPCQAYEKSGVTLALPLLVDGPIPTLEGLKKAYAGDYLCIGVKGEIWPYRKANFEQEKVKLYDINEHLSVYKSTGVRYACWIDEQFSIVRDDGTVAFTSAEEGGYVVWSGNPEPEAFKAWIVERSIFEASYTLAGVEENYSELHQP